MRIILICFRALFKENPYSLSLSNFDISTLSSQSSAITISHRKLELKDFVIDDFTVKEELSNIFDLENADLI